MATHSKTPDRGVRPPADFNPRAEPVLDFPDADFGSLSPADYDTLGFLCGLEVHQQLATRSKLFCRCPAGRNDTTYDAEVLRHMRPTLSELGEYDGTALMEFKTRKEIVYRLDRGSVCTYEIDDTPPFGIDDEAVRIAMAISELLNLSLVSELHVMRKQYLDGSIPTGFQRTAMVGLGGTIPFVVPELGVRRELSIRQLSLEEDSCREVSDVGHRITFRTDRLGMPLTETVTEPELRTPLEVEAAGRLLASVARATGRVRRGPGAARQDVNVSIAGGRRIEIKGTADQPGMPRLVHVEAFRQLTLLRIRAELVRRGVTDLQLPIPPAGPPWETSPLVFDATDFVRRSAFDPVRHALERDEVVCAVRLPAFAGLLTHRTQPGVTFAQEFSERVRVIACPTHRPFMTHSDLGEDGLTARTWRDLGRQLGAGSDDAIILLWAPAADAATGAREVLARARDALAGIPAETRQGHRDGTTGFERILPGPDRMYPDTDTPPLPIADDVVERVRARLPEAPWRREERYVERGLAFDVARRLARSPWSGAFDAGGAPPGELSRRLAAALLKRLPYHARRAGAPPELPSDRLAAVVTAVADGRVRAEALDRLLDALVVDPEAPVERLVAVYAPRPDDDARLEQALDDTLRAADALEGRTPETLVRWAMGRLMAEFLGRRDPRAIRARLIERFADAHPEAA